MGGQKSQNQYFTKRRIEQKKESTKFTISQRKLKQIKDIEKIKMVTEKRMTKKHNRSSASVQTTLFTKQTMKTSND